MGWAGAFAFLIGIPLMRLSGIGAAIGTFSWLTIVFVVHAGWEEMTGGTSSFNGLPIYVDIWVALIAALFVMLVAYIFQSSKLGLALRASREDEVAARAIGVNLWRARIASFVISAMLVALGGVLQGHFLGTVNVTQFYIGITFITIAMLVIGGTGSLAGAVIGTVAVSVIAELLRHLEKGCGDRRSYPRRAGGLTRARARRRHDADPDLRPGGPDGWGASSPSPPFSVPRLPHDPANPHFSPRSRPASRPGVRSARSGPKSVAGTTVEARDAGGGRLGATRRAALSGRQCASRRLPDAPHRAAPRSYSVGRTAPRRP